MNHEKLTTNLIAEVGPSCISLLGRVWGSGDRFYFPTTLPRMVIFPPVECQGLGYENDEFYEMAEKGLIKLKQIDIYRHLEGDPIDPNTERAAFIGLSNVITDPDYLGQVKPDKLVEFLDSIIVPGGLVLFTDDISIHVNRRKTQPLYENVSLLLTQSNWKMLINDFSNERMDHWKKYKIILNTLKNLGITADPSFKNGLQYASIKSTESIVASFGPVYWMLYQKKALKK